MLKALQYDQSNANSVAFLKSPIQSTLGTLPMGLHVKHVLVVLEEYDKYKSALSHTSSPRLLIGVDQMLHLHHTHTLPDTMKIECFNLWISMDIFHCLFVFFHMHNT